MKTQADVFTATMNNFKSALEAVSVAQNSFGSAMRENEAYMDSLEAKTNKIHSEFNNLVLGDGGLSSLTGFLLDGTGALLSFANSGLGQAIIKTTAFTLALNGMIKGFEIFKKSKVASDIINISSQIKNLKGSLAGAKVTTETLTTAWNASPFGLKAAVIIGSIIAIAKAIDKIVITSEESYERLREFNSEVDELTDKSENLDSKIEEVNNELAKLNKIPTDKLTNSQKETLKTLTLQSEELKRQKRVNDILLQQANQKAEAEAKSFLNKPIRTTYVSEGDNTWQKPTEALQGYLDKLKVLSDKQDYINKLFDEGSLTAEAYTIRNNALKDTIEEVTNNGNELVTQLVDISKNLTSTDVETQRQKKSVDKLVDSWLDLNSETKNTTPSLEALADELGMTVEELENAADAAGLTAEQFYQNQISAEDNAQAVEELRNQMKDLASDLDGVQSAYETLNAVADDYNATGEVSISNLSKLLQLNPDYWDALSMVNGQLVVNEESLLAVAEKMAQNAAVTMYGKDQTNEFSDAIVNANNASNNTDFGNLVSQLGNVARQSFAAASGLKTFFDRLTGKESGTGTGKGVQEYVEGVQNGLVDALSNIKFDTPKSRGGGGSRGAKKAGASAGKATGDAYKEAYQKELDSLDHDLAMNVISQKEYYNKLKELNEKYFGVASGNHEKYLDEYRKNEEKIFKGLQDLYKETADYLSEQFDKKIEQIEKAKDAELEEIDAEIEDIERVRDKKLDAIQDQIDAIEKERDTVLDSLEKQKDALEDAQDAELDRIDKELDTLESQRDSVEKYWNDKISALQKANEEIDKQIKLEELQAALEAARYQKVKVFKDGKFQYVQDESAVEEAEQNLADYEEELKRQQEIEALENQRDDELAILDEKISNMENYRDQVKENYDKQIEDLEEYIEQTEEKYETQLEDLQNFYDEISEKYEQRIERLEEHRKDLEEEYNEQIKLYENQKEKFEQYVNAQEEQQKRELANQITGLQTENEVWMTRLENLAEFITEYNRMLAKKGEEGESVSSHYRGKASIPSQISSYAVGSPSVDDDELAVVGENPYKEIIIGSTLNKNGSLLKLRQGSGVVNSNATDTLARNLNELAKFGESKSYNNYSSLTNDTSSNQYFNFDKLVLPNVKNAEEFMDVLSTQYKNYMIQTVNSRQ